VHTPVDTLPPGRDRAAGVGVDARMLLIVNPASSNSDRERELTVVRELQREFQLEVARTDGPGHATELSRETGRSGGAVVAVLGGDGAVNEAANGLAGTNVPLAPLPAGRTNVFCRLLGVPDDPSRAAAALSELVARHAEARPGEPAPARRVDLGVMNGRHFTFASGVGLIAEANRRLGARGVAGQRRAGLVFALEALAVVAGYVREPPRIELSLAGHAVEGISLVAQNADPLSYFGRRPLSLCPDAGLDTGTLSFSLLRGAALGSAAGLASRLLRGRAAPGGGDAGVASWPSAGTATARSLDGRSLPVEVDGDYVGEAERVEYTVAPGALSVLAAPATAPR
jgi:diacylglycerol kinase family enzyme